jgi:chemotaxis protein MotA
MDLATVLGILVGLSFTFIVVILSEGVKGLAPFMNYESFLIVMGGTACALLVNYPLKQVFRTFKVVRVAFTTNTENSEDLSTDIITTFSDLSKKSKSEGFLALANDIKKINNDFLRRGVQMVVDGLEKDFIANMLETELGIIRERHKVGQEIFNSLGTYSPAFGIIGTVLGMMLMLNSITDVQEVPRRMALALASAFFGLGSGYLIFLPIAGKLKRRSDEEVLVKEIIIRGVLLLQAGTTPSILEENLKAYLEPSKRAAMRSSAK